MACSNTATSIPIGRGKREELVVNNLLNEFFTNERKREREKRKKEKEIEEEEEERTTRYVCTYTYKLIFK